MKSKIILGIITLIFGATLALPTQAASVSADAMTPRQIIASQLNYQVTNAVNGVIVNITSTNQGWVDKLHAKYDNLPKTSKKFYNNQIEVDLIKIDNGIQVLITVLHPAGSNYQNLIEKVQNHFASAKHAVNSTMKINIFLLNHFQWLL